MRTKKSSGGKRRRHSCGWRRKEKEKEHSVCPVVLMGCVARMKKVKERGTRLCDGLLYQTGRGERIQSLKRLLPRPMVGSEGGTIIHLRSEDSHETEGRKRTSSERRDASWRREGSPSGEVSRFERKRISRSIGDELDQMSCCGIREDRKEGKMSIPALRGQQTEVN